MNEYDIVAPGVKIYTEARVTLVSRTQFLEPEHMPTNWVGEASDGERLAEFAGRMCYMSQHNPAGKTNAEYLENIKKQGHGSVTEHANYGLLLEGVSRSLTHEFVRHRAGWAYAQLSQRYVDSSDTAFVMPPTIQRMPKSLRLDWARGMYEKRSEYEVLAETLEYQLQSEIKDKVLRRKRAREAARSVLPNATETKIVVTGNARAWRHVLELRGNIAAEAEIQRCAVQCWNLLKTEAPNFFGDFSIDSEGSLVPEYSKI